MLDRHVSNLILDNSSRKQRKKHVCEHMITVEAREGLWKTNLLVRELKRWVLGLHVLHELSKTVEERDHSKVEPAVVQETPEVQIPRAVEFVRRLVTRRTLDPRKRAHGHEPVAARDRYS